MHKHTHKELTGKLRQAIEAFNHGRVSQVAEAHTEQDLEELNLDTVEALLDIVYDCLQIALENPVTCFKPPHPPKSTRHELTKGLPMWAFEVQHPEYSFKLYFKFCLKPQRDGTHYCHIDCHESRRKTP